MKRQEKMVLNLPEVLGHLPLEVQVDQATLGILYLPEKLGNT